MSGLMRKDRDGIQACTAMIAGLFAVLVMLAGPTEKAYAQGPLVADISADEVAITIDFNGASLLLFGAAPPHRLAAGLLAQLLVPVHLCGRG